MPPLVLELHKLKSLWAMRHPYLSGSKMIILQILTSVIFFALYLAGEAHCK